MTPAVDDEAGGPDDVHALIDQRLAGKLACREQQVRKQDERRPRPADDFYCELDCGHAGQLRPSTCLTGTPSSTPGSSRRALTPMRSCGGSVSGTQCVMM